MATAGKLDQGRESFRQQAWAGAYALLSSADQVPMSVGEGFGQVSAQFRELEELGQTPPRLVEHVVARLSDSGAVTGEFMSKAVRALGAQASVPSEVPEPEDVGPDALTSAAVRALIAQHTRAPRRADLTYRRDPDGVSDSVHWMRVAARRLRNGLRVFRSLLDREWADELKCAGSGLGEERELEVLIARLEMRIAALPADAVPDDPSVGAMGRTREQQAPGKGRRLVSVRTLPRVAGTAQRRRSHATQDGGGGSAGQPGAAAAVPQGLATAGEAGRSCPRERVGPARWCAGRRMAPDAEWHQMRIAAKRARYAGEAVAPVLGEEAAAFARQMEKVTEILGEHQEAADAGTAIRELATSADAPASFTVGVLHAADASELRRPAAGSRRCGPKSAAASGADG